MTAAYSTQQKIPPELKDGENFDFLEDSAQSNALSKIRYLLSPGYTSMTQLNGEMTVGEHPVTGDNAIDTRPIPGNENRQASSSEEKTMSEIISILESYRLLPTSPIIAVEQTSNAKPNVQANLLEEDPLNVDLIRNPPKDIQPPSLHPMQPAKCSHIDDFATIRDDLMKACESGIGKEMQYKGVYALLLSWEDDDLGVASELDLVEEVFKERYDFNVERFTIPNKPNAVNYVRNAIDVFQINHYDPHYLYIIYYGGHGTMNADQDCEFHPNITKENWFNWNSVQQNQLETAPQDTLILLDCCYAGAAVTRRSALPSVTEVLGAASREVKAAGVSLSSFTQRLLYELWYTTEETLYVDKIAEKLVPERKTHSYETQPFWWPVNGRDAKSIGLRVANPLAKPKNPKLLRSYRPSNNILHPRQSATSQEKEIFEDDTASSLSGWKSKTDPTEYSSMEDTESHGHKALLSIRLKKTLKAEELSLPDMVNWLRKAPKGMESLEDISFEALHDAGSSLLIISCPIRIWLHLRDDPAYTFVGFVQSGNLLKLTSAPAIARVESAQQTISNDERQDLLKQMQQGFARLESHYKKDDARQIDNFKKIQSILDKLSTHLDIISKKVRRSTSSGPKSQLEPSTAKVEERTFLTRIIHSHMKDKQKPRETYLEDIAREVTEVKIEVKALLVEYKIRLESASEPVKEKE